MELHISDEETKPEYHWNNLIKKEQSFDEDEIIQRHLSNEK